VWSGSWNRFQDEQLLDSTKWKPSFETDRFKRGPIFGKNRINRGANFGGFPISASFEHFLTFFDGENTSKPGVA